MNILCITGSPRVRGNTARIVEVLAEKLLRRSNEAAKIHTLHLAEYDVRTCKGCRICFNTGENHCPLKDDLPAIKKEIDDSDILILASPVYVEDVSGTMKNWLDRMAFVCHRPEYFGKSAFSLSTSGIGSTSHTLRTMNTALRTWGYSIIGAATFATGESMSADVMRTKFGTRLDRIADRILRHAGCLKTTSPSSLSLMTFKIQQLYYERTGDPESFDYQFWKSRGWLEKSRAYYLDNKVSGIKRFAVKVTGSLVAKLVLK